MSRNKRKTSALQAVAVTTISALFILTALFGLYKCFSQEPTLRPSGPAAPDPDPSAAQDAGAPEDEEAVYTGSDYFASARLTRQQARDNALSLLQEAAEQENADQAVANEASQGIQVLASYTLKEAQIENLVTAKGYTDCVAFMGDGSVSVVVSTKSGELTAEDVAKITDITMTETGLPAGGIKIMAAN